MPHFAEETPELRHKLVLVVDDDPESRLLLTQYLESLGCDVITARTGKQGFYNAHSYQPDLVVLDVKLPDMTGWEVLSQIRKEPSTRHLHAVVVSGTADLGERALIAGLDAVSKPVNPLDLYEAVRRNVRKRAGRILIIDDSEDDRTLLAGFLEPHVEEIRTAVDGAEAMDVLRSYDADLILLDLMMPRMDGFQFLRALRESVRHSDTPVLVITGKTLSAEESKVIRAETQGMVGKGGQLSKAIRMGLQSLVGGDR